eukprot:scaffold15824_cov84-Skeletonema_dohrnii-CCMP3373.AAC.3
MSESGSNSQQSAESLLSKELLSYCNSDSISKEGLQEIIERHDYKNRQVSNYKFFLRACINKRVNKGIIQCLLEYFPYAINVTGYLGQTPLQFACHNANVTVDIIQLLVDAAPNSVRSEDADGDTPLHSLSNYVLGDTKAIKILKLLIEKQPEAVRHVNNNGCLPIHIAGGWGRRSTEFCRLLIESYPGSERISNLDGNLPLHNACLDNTLATVEYLYELYPDAINLTTTRGHYPIHTAILGVIKKRKRASPLDRLGIVQFLLDSDPNVTSQKVDGESLLNWACRKGYNDSNIEAALEMIKAIYDVNPEAIVKNRMLFGLQSYHEQVQAFRNSQLVYVRQAKNLRLMMTPDSNGRLPLHTALQNNVRLGSIKLLVKGNPSAIRNADINFAKPLHIACQHHSSVNVVQYLVGLDTTTLDAVDKEGDTALHYACRGAKYDTIALLLEKYDAVSVSKRNAHGKLPIDLLWESSEVLDRGSVEYTGSVFRLLKAYPEAIMVMNIDMQQQQSASASCPTQNGRKKKFGMTNER